MLQMTWFLNHSDLKITFVMGNGGVDMTRPSSSTVFAFCKAQGVLPFNHIYYCVRLSFFLKENWSILSINWNIPWLSLPYSGFNTQFGEEIKPYINYSGNVMCCVTRTKRHLGAMEDCGQGSETMECVWKVCTNWTLLCYNDSYWRTGSVCHFACMRYMLHLAVLGY